MPIFQYKAINSQGQVVSDSITAASRSQAIDTLIAQGLHPSNVQETNKAEQAPSSQRFGSRLSRKDIEMYTRQIANLLGSGLPLSRALKILGRESSKPAGQELWTKVHDNVANGMSFADALGQWPKYFPPIYVAMVQAGETGGFLELVLSQIADFRAQEQDLRARVQSAMIYPVVLMVLAVMILIFLLTYFIPRFTSIFAEFGGTLPALTRGIVAASGFILSYGVYVIVAIVFLVLIGRSYLQREEGKAAVERAILKAPLLGSLTAQFAFVRFARMLGTLLNAGVPLISALQVAREAIGNRTLANTMNDAIEKVRKGSSLSLSLRECPQLFSGTNIEMIAVAEESSRLGEELSRLAEVNEKDLDQNLKTAVSFAEPAMLFLMAGFVGTIVIGMLMPIFNLQELIH